jgi:hypothetical protein
MTMNKIPIVDGLAGTYYNMGGFTELAIWRRMVGNSSKIRVLFWGYKHTLCEFNNYNMNYLGEYERSLLTVDGDG